MSKQFHYELNCGQYVLFADGIAVSEPLDEIAICLDRSCGTRHKHGNPVVVRAWCSLAQQAFRNNGHDDMADDLVVIQGRFTLDDITKVLENSSYTAVLYAKVMDGTAEMLDPHGKVVRPALTTA